MIALGTDPSELRLGGNLGLHGVELILTRVYEFDLTDEWLIEGRQLAQATQTQGVSGRAP